MKKCVVVPTYWGPIDGCEDVIFDHPTPINGKNTLETLLDNLSKYPEVKNREIPVILVSVPNKISIWEDVEKRTNEITKNYEDKMKIINCSYSWYKKVLNRLDKINNETIEDLISPVSYGQVRNLSLLAALETDCDYAIFLDDDEVLMDNDYFKISEDGIKDKMLDNGIMHGKAGYYEQDRPNLRWFRELVWWPKDRVFNEAFGRLMDENPRFKTTLVAMGGNMIMTRELMKDVCFDPDIRRGEDIDYVFNARMSGYRFYFDPKLRIKHLAPELKTPSWRKAGEDMRRFLYLRSKFLGHIDEISLQNVSIDEFMPYPGTFMQDDIETRIVEHARFISHEYLLNDDKEAAKGVMDAALKVFQNKEESKTVIKRFIKRRDNWRIITNNF